MVCTILDSKMMEMAVPKMTEAQNLMNKLMDVSCDRVDRE